MEEKYEGGEIRIQSPFMKRIENFWYHYKWHSLIALFLVVTITVCTVQLFTREKYDLHVLYAGKSDIKQTASDGLSEHRILHASLKLTLEDYDENGEVSLNLQTLFLPSAEEIEEINAGLDTGYEVQTQVVTENQNQMEGLMLLSEYYLCFLSEANYLAYRDRAAGFFVSLTPYVGDAGVSYYEGRTDAVYLSSTAFGTMPGWKDMADDTVICLRSVSEVARRSGKNNEKQFARAEQTLRNLFAMKES